MIYAPCLSQKPYVPVSGVFRRICWLGLMLILSACLAFQAGADESNVVRVSGTEPDPNPNNNSSLSIIGIATQSNQVAVGSDQLDPDPENNHGEQVLAFPPDLRCFVIDNNPEFIPGRDQVYVFVFENSGRGDAENLDYSDQFAPPTGVTGNGPLMCSIDAGCATAAQAGDYSTFSAANCTAGTSGDSIEYSSLGNSVPGTFTATPAAYCVAVPVTFQSSTLGDYTHNPSYVLDGATAVGCTTQASANTPQGDIAVSKTNNNGAFDLGGSQQYTIELSNAGPSDTFGITLVDILPEQGAASNIAASCSCPDPDNPGSALEPAQSNCAASLSSSIAVDTSVSRPRFEETLDLPAACTVRVVYDLVVNE